MFYIEQISVDSFKKLIEISYLRDAGQKICTLTIDLLTTLYNTQIGGYWKIFLKSFIENL